MMITCAFGHLWLPHAEWIYVGNILAFAKHTAAHRSPDGRRRRPSEAAWCPSKGTAHALAFAKGPSGQLAQMSKAYRLTQSGCWALLPMGCPSPSLHVGPRRLHVVLGGSPGHQS